MSMLRLTAAAGLAWALATPPVTLAQTAAEPASSLQAGIALYAAAAYDEEPFSNSRRPVCSPHWSSSREMGRPTEAAGRWWVS